MHPAPPPGPGPGPRPSAPSPLAAPARTFPLDPGGAAGPMGLPVPGLCDRSALARFGLKGPGTSRWLRTQGIGPPPVNRWIATSAGRLLRLGEEEIVFLAEGPDMGPEALRARWLADAAATPRGYETHRDEGWAWFRLEGAALPGQMGAFCALDLREGAFAPDAVAQTRLFGIEAVLLRTGQAAGRATGFDVLFDMTCTHHVAGVIATHVHRLSGRT